MDHICDATSAKENKISTFVKIIDENTERKRFCNCMMAYPIFQALDQDFVSQIYKIKICDNNGASAFIFTKDKMVYGIGNDIKQFGVGDTIKQFDIRGAYVKRTNFNKPWKLDILCAKKIKKLIHFLYYDTTDFASDSIILTEEGEIYSWGTNRYRLLGNGDPSFYNVYLPAPVLTLFKEVVIDVVCSTRHVLALTQSEKLYTWGETLSHIPKKQYNYCNDKIKQICCGASLFNIVVTHSGEVYSWGNNDKNQLGIYCTETRDYIERVKIISRRKIVKVACGYSHVIALDDKGCLFHWGSYMNNDITDYQITWSIGGKIIDINALPHKHTSVALNSSGCIYIWGHYRDSYISKPVIVQVSNMWDIFDWSDIPYAICMSPLVPPNNIGTDETSDVVESLETAFDDSSTSDFAVQVEGNVIHVHKTILNIRSVYFRTMFQNTWKENNQNVLIHDQFSYDVYRSFLKYLYTGKIDLSWEKLIDLYALADSYLETKLKNKCIQMLKQKITLENAILLYNTAVKYNVEELQKSCFKFILDNIRLIKETEDFIKLDEKSQIYFLCAAINLYS